jgi:micrococcal nuclease
MRARAALLLLALISLVALVSPSLSSDPAPSPSPSAPSPHPLARGERDGEVVRTVDGDTIYVRLATGVEKVRYIGVDTPEVHHPTRGEEPGGREAAVVNRRLLGDRPVRLETDVQLRDRYGRLLAYVWARRPDGGLVMVNAELVRLGYAAVMTVPPNVRHAALFRRLAAEAREQHRGLWAEPLTEPRGILPRDILKIR